ncbi:MAG: hypothetical protein KIT20_03080 [Alphaproteobacteria bacterium]|nr:hypothetical protein [Alphaproteobacteria bacterium]
MFKSNIIAGLIGMAFLCAFLTLVLSYMRVKEPVIIGISIIVVLMMLYDWYLSIRQIRRDAAERENEES